MTNEPKINLPSIGKEQMKIIANVFMLTYNEVRGRIVHLAAETYGQEIYRNDFDWLQQIADYQTTLIDLEKKVKSLCKDDMEEIFADLSDKIYETIARKIPNFYDKPQDEQHVAFKTFLKELIKNRI